MVSRVAGVPVLGLLIDVGALVSLFAATLACITAAARVLLLMAHDGLAHTSLQATHVRNQTPSRAVVITPVSQRYCPWSCWRHAATPADWTSMDGLDRWPLMGSSWLMDWFASRVCQATCGIKVFSNPGAEIVPWLAGAAICWRW